MLKQKAQHAPGFPRLNPGKLYTRNGVRYCPHYHQCPNCLRCSEFNPFNPVCIECERENLEAGAVCACDKYLIRKLKYAIFDPRRGKVMSPKDYFEQMQREQDIEKRIAEAEAEGIFSPVEKVNIKNSETGETITLINEGMQNEQHNR